jgi:hypothetical protein
MKKLKLHVDQKSIDRYLNRLPGALEDLQQIYDKLNSDDYTVNLDTLKDLLQRYFGNVAADERQEIIEEFIKELTVNALDDSRSVKHIKRSELVKMIQYDEAFAGEVTELISSFSDRDNTGFNLDMLNYIDFDNVKKRPEIINNHRDIISERFTLYASNERQIEAYNVCKDLIKYIDIHFNTEGLGRHWTEDFGLPGLKLENQKFIVDVHYIRTIL